MKAGKLIVCLAVFTLLFTGMVYADTPRAFMAGDLLVSLSNGRVQWRSSDGTLIRQFDTGNHGQAKGMAFDATGNLFVTHWFAPDFQTGNNIEVFTPNGIFAGRFGSGFDCNPTSIVFDSMGNAFVGQADCGGKVLKFNSAGVLLASFAVATENRGSSWIDLGPDDCTLFYTSAGPNVKRFNVCTNTQLPDFNGQMVFDNGMWGFRLLPDGSALVAFSTNDQPEFEIRHMNPPDASGMSFGGLVMAVSGGHCWYGVNRGSDMNTFWAGDFCNGEVFQFDLNRGGVLARFSTGEGTHVKGVIVVPAIPGVTSPPAPPSTPTPTSPSTPPSTPPPPPPVVECRMTGGGSVFTTNGVRVTHGFEVRAPASVTPQSLEVNWNVPGTPRSEMHFHLTQMIFATCIENPNINAGHPVTPFNTFIGVGTGDLNGVPGATIEFVFTDAGEPGTNDMATMTIRDSSGTVVLVVSNTLDNGNHQMH